MKSNIFCRSISTSVYKSTNSKLPSQHILLQSFLIFSPLQSPHATLSLILFPPPPVKTLFTSKVNFHFSKLLIFTSLGTQTTAQCSALNKHLSSLTKQSVFWRCIIFPTHGTRGQHNPTILKYGSGSWGKTNPAPQHYNTTLSHE